jgi:hypothetical protein
MTDKVKGDIVRQCDFYLVKALLYNGPRIGLVSAVILLSKGGQRVRNDDKVEWLFLADRDNLLELAQRCAI